jgi:hypothetical protein
VATEQFDRRVERVAHASLSEHEYVSAVDVLIGLGWLTPQRVSEWRQGRVPSLEQVARANLHKISRAMAAFRRWAQGEGLKPSETAYLARTRDHRPLQFSMLGSASVERAYRTHWVSPALSEAKQRRLTERQSRAPDLVVISALNDWTCSECSGSGELLFMEDDGPICMDCADLGHLVLLPRGDAALTRRAKRASGLSAVVVRFSRARQRYERQGILVEEAALEQAEAQCLEDQEARERRRRRGEERRSPQDLEFQSAFSAAIVELFPSCPPERARAVAEHAAQRGSGRVGRSAAGRALDPEAITLAVLASVRHLDTRYDDLLMSGTPRAEARVKVSADGERVLDGWRHQAR